MRRKLVAGNWKMNGLRADLALLDAVNAACDGLGVDCDGAVCPPAPLLGEAVRRRGALEIGGQDCHPAASGAHTGDVSAQMLHDLGASYVIVGHSERRESYGERSEQVRAKAEAALEAGLVPIVCVGESLLEREQTNTLDVIGAQLSLSLPQLSQGQTLVVAYEPVWAIGSGRIPTSEQIAQVHAFMRTRLNARYGAPVAEAIRLLYGGSVKPGNAAAIFALPDVDGALVGGASLDAASFSAIINAAAPQEAPGRDS